MSNASAPVLDEQQTSQKGSCETMTTDTHLVPAQMGLDRFVGCRLSSAGTAMNSKPGSVPASRFQGCVVPGCAVTSGVDSVVPGGARWGTR